MNAGMKRAGLALGLALFVTAGLITASGQFVPPQPPSGGGGVQAFTCAAGQAVVSCDAAGVCTCADFNASSVLSPQSYYHYEEDSTAICQGTASCGYYSNSGFTAPATSSATQEGGQLSYWILSPGNGGSLILHRNVAASGPILLGTASSAFVHKFRVRIPTLSDGVNAATSRYGVAKWGANNALPTDIVAAEYAFATNGNVWTLLTCKASVCNRLKCDGTGGTINKPVTANTWTVLTVSVSADGSTASLTVDGGVVCGSTTTDIPLSTTAMQPGVQVVTTLGVVDRPVHHNWSTGFANVARP
jgi:hypothetical protein